MKYDYAKPTKMITSYAIMVALVVLSLRVLPVTYAFNIYEFPRNNTVFTLYYKLAEFTLWFADSNDTVILRIDSHGGSALSGLSMAAAVRNSEATTIAHIVSGAYSAGAVVAISADKITSEEYTTILFHKARVCRTFGGCKVVDHLPVDKFLSVVVKPYLTPLEFAVMMKGYDIEIFSDTFIARFEAGGYREIDQKVDEEFLKKQGKTLEQYIKGLK